MSALATTAFPNVKELSSEQRKALMLELVKAWFNDAGWPAPFVVSDGDKVLGIFKPEWHTGAKPAIPDFPPEFIEEMKRRNEEIVDGRAKLYSTKEILDLLETADGRNILGL